jgi:dTDP-4-dehydrorhamnose reductase
MKNILILGHNGMLGNMVLNFFKKTNKYNIFALDEKFPSDAFKDKIKQIECDIIVNCIGKIPQKTPTKSDIYLINTYFPVWLAENKPNSLIVHPSTDCVFNGATKKLMYDNDDNMDANDVYGKSKRLASELLNDFNNVFEIRTSIIGPELYDKKSLFEWILNKNETERVNGYINHFWNGITTLQWAKLLHDFIQNETFSKKIQIGTDRIDKFNLLKMICSIFNLKRNIIEFETKETVNKCLKSDINIISLEKQLQELYLFLRNE